MENAPELTRPVVEHGYADFYTNDALDQRARKIATLASLITSASLPQFEWHTRGALESKLLTTDEIREIIVQMTIYIGYPAAYNALAVAKRVFADSSPVALPPPAIRLPCESLSRPASPPRRAGICKSSGRHRHAARATDDSRLPARHIHGQSGQLLLNQISGTLQQRATTHQLLILQTRPVTQTPAFHTSPALRPREVIPRKHGSGPSSKEAREQRPSKEEHGPPCPPFTNPVLFWNGPDSPHEKIPHHRHVLHARHRAVAGLRGRDIRKRSEHPAVEHDPVPKTRGPQPHRHLAPLDVRVGQHPVVRQLARRVRAESPSRPPAAQPGFRARPPASARTPRRARVY